MNSRRLLLIWVPLALNALLYLTWRDWSLWCFRWVEWGQATEVVRAWRGFAGNLGTPPEFVRFSLASGLWIFGVSNALLSIWRRAPRPGQRRLGQTLCLALLAGCIATEAAQAQNWMVSTADWNDVLAYVGGVGLAFFIAERAWGTQRVLATPDSERRPASRWDRLMRTSPHVLSTLIVGSALLLATGAYPG